MFNEDASEHIDVTNMSDLEQVKYLEEILISVATSNVRSHPHYSELRSYFIKSSQYKNLVPQFVSKSYDLRQFWSFIKYKYSSYEERRLYIWDAFQPLKDFIENGESPLSFIVSDAYSNIDCGYINEKWASALDEVDKDPERVITLARTILESTCKHILDCLGEEHSSYDLPKLYGTVAKKLNLAPNQHNEETFRKILGGCHTVVNGLGELRNSLGDAHGTTKKSYKVQPRHARLAINLAGSTSLFLLETYLARMNTVS